MSQVLYFVESVRVNKAGTSAGHCQNGPFRDVDSAQQYAVQACRVPYTISAKVIAATLAEIAAWHDLNPSSHQARLATCRNMLYPNGRALEALSGPEFGCYDAAHGLYDREVWDRAIKGDAEAQDQMRARLSATANGIDYCGNGGTYPDRVQAARGCLAVWDR